MCSHDADRSTIVPQTEDARPADERDVVKVHDIRVRTIENFPQGVRLEERQPGGLGGKWRKEAISTFERMNMQAGSWRVLSERVKTAYCVEGIDAVVNMDFVPPTAKSLAKTFNIGRVTSIAVTAKESRDHTKLHRRPPVAGCAEPVNPAGSSRQRRQS
jgi:hypothetical protein